ncbi:hypothetical protein N9W34_04840 [Rickettsiales bacterium]|nr:hypothetical protein [Rickettsiales bacterium]
MFKKIIFITLSLLLLTSCSVYKAAKNDGASIEDVRSCKSKECFLTLGAEILEKKKNDGKESVIYRVQRRKHGSTYARALFHGVADVSTFGLWEIVATPLEGYMSNEKYIVFKVLYDEDDAVLKVNIQGEA